MNVKSVGAEFSLLKKVGDLTLQPQPRQDAFFPGQDHRSVDAAAYGLVREESNRPRTQVGQGSVLARPGRVGAMRPFSAA